jgi:LEA14-like dessication related protein
MKTLRLLAIAASLTLSACATLPEPLNVSVAGIESMKGEGMEMRMLVKLRIQNPNDKEVAFNGASLRMNVQRRTFATGVSDASGTLPRLGETVVEVPVTISTLNIIRQVMGMAMGEPVDKVNYSMQGKLHTGGMSGMRFGTDGVMDMPKSQGSAQGPAKEL